MWVAVSGPSMVPALRDGDAVIARTGVAIRPGDVVLARFRTMPDVLVVKRAVRTQDGGWWLASDNSFAGGDSPAHGVADVVGRVLVRWRGGGFPRVRVVRRDPSQPVADVQDSTPPAIREN